MRIWVRKCGSGPNASELFMIKDRSLGSWWPVRLLSQKFMAIFCRTDSAHTAECARKVLLRFETASYGDVQNTHLGCAQHLFGMLYLLAKHKLMRALASRPSKHLREVSRAQAR